MSIFNFINSLFQKLRKQQVAPLCQAMPELVKASNVRLLLQVCFLHIETKFTKPLLPPSGHDNADVET